MKRTRTLQEEDKRPTKTRRIELKNVEDFSFYSKRSHVPNLYSKLIQICGLSTRYLAISIDDDEYCKFELHKNKNLDGKHRDLLVAHMSKWTMLDMYDAFEEDKRIIEYKFNFKKYIIGMRKYTQQQIFNIMPGPPG